MNGQDQIDSPTSTDSTPAPRRKRARFVVIGVAVVALSVAAYVLGGQVVRGIEYKMTGAVDTQGLKVYLHPNDQTITPTVIKIGTWEPNETQEMCELLRPGDTFIDVGADFGWYSLNASKAVGPKGKVIAFEPVPDNFKFLKRNFEANHCDNATAEPLAVSNKRDTLTFHLSQSNLGDHSMLNASDRPGNLKVQAVSLDDYLKDYQGNVALVKIDVQGAEGLVLDGMRETLKRYPKMALILEYTPYALRDSGYDPEKILRDFHAQGYEIRSFNLKWDRGWYRRGWNWTRTIPVPESEIGSLSKMSAFCNLFIRRP
jgi:FkbM family methyltransferase